jgi:hypothetical protein
LLAESKINRSLLALGNCIQKLASGDERRFINYRDRRAYPHRI